MANQSGFFWDESFVCSTSASLNSNQFFAVSLSTSLLPPSTGGGPPVLLCTSASQGTNAAIGILQNDPKAGQAAVVRLLGISKFAATTSAAVTYGAPLASTTGGQAMVADTSGQRLIGVCIAASTTLVSGALVEVMIQPRPIVGLV